MYELDEDEWTEIESEFGTKFTSDADVDPVDEADIDMSDADDPTEQLEDEFAATAKLDPESATAAAEPGPVVDSGPEPVPDAASDGDEDKAGADPDVDGSAEDINLESAIMDAMNDLSDGDSATRDEIIMAVVDEHGTDPGVVEDATQEALLGGRCYEPQDGVLKAT